jgi:hypothetical protein
MPLGISETTSLASGKSLLTFMTVENKANEVSVGIVLTCAAIIKVKVNINIKVFFNSG